MLLTKAVMAWRGQLESRRAGRPEDLRASSAQGARSWPAAPSHNSPGEDLRDDAISIRKAAPAMASAWRM